MATVVVEVVQGTNKRCRPHMENKVLWVFNEMEKSWNEVKIAENSQGLKAFARASWHRW